MDAETPLSCPYTVTLRRNPHRKARATPLNPDHPPAVAIHPYPMEDILSIDLPQNDPQDLRKPPMEAGENLKVFLRVRPLATSRLSPGAKGGRVLKEKNVWPQSRGRRTGTREKKPKKSEICVRINDCQSVTLTPPQALQDLKRTKSEVFGGFSHVFSAEASQEEVYQRMVNPLVEDFLRGRSIMLAALGPSGSGKTHTVFGSPKEPGMVGLALHRIFEQTKEIDSKSSRSLFISMFEIYSDGGKSERLLDLSPEGADLCMQQSTTKGIQEVVVFDCVQAESVIARGVLKRATTMTCLNSQSSRSHCMISIRVAGNNTAEDIRQNNAVLTIVDLAGSEKEKRTGHQGAKLLESNFINNTSLVFGLCLRSLLEHQKNPKKPLQKHFQNSLLTRFLRDYLEGKKRMALILTVKPGEEDYLDTSFLLRQASPYMRIKFINLDKQPDMLSNKRCATVFPKNEQPKRIKSTKVDSSVIEKSSEADEVQLNVEGAILEQLAEVEPCKALVHSPKVTDVKVSYSESRDIACTNCNERERSAQIMLNFARALWNVLKQYKGKLEVAEKEVHSLNESLKIAKTLNFQLERELSDVKLRCSCSKDVSAKKSLGKVDTVFEYRFCGSPEPKGHSQPNIYELNAELDGLESGHSPSLELVAEGSPFQLDDDSKTRRCRSPVHFASIHKLNAGVEKSYAKLDSDLESRFSRSPELMADSSVDVNKRKPEVKDSQSGCSLGVEPLAEMSNAKLVEESYANLVNDLESRFHRSLELIADSSVDDNEAASCHLQPKTEVKDLKSGFSLGSEPLAEISYGKWNNDYQSRSCRSPELMVDGSVNVTEATGCHSQLKPKMEDLRSGCSLGLEPLAETSYCNLNDDSHSWRRFCVSPELMTHGYADDNKLNAKVEVLKSRCSSGRELPAKNSFDKVDNDSEPRFGGRPELLMHSSNVDELNAKVEDFKVGHLSCEEHLMEASSERFGSFGTHECLSIARCANGAEESTLLVREATWNANCTESDFWRSEPVVGSSLANAEDRNDACLLVEGHDLHGKEHKLEVLEQDVVHTRGSNNTSSTKEPSKPIDVGKPKRRLLPASTILVRGINNLDLEDESEKRKGNRGEKNLTSNERKRTQGSISLLRLLKSNIHLQH